jgi:hypothetical protein
MPVGRADGAFAGPGSGVGFTWLVDLASVDSGRSAGIDLREPDTIAPTHRVGREVLTRL